MIALFTHTHRLLTTSLMLATAPTPSPALTSAQSALDRLSTMVPELTLLITVALLMISGTSRDREARRFSTWIAVTGLLCAMMYAMHSSLPVSLMPALAGFVRPVACAVGLLLILGMSSIDRVLETQIETGKRKFDPLDTTQGEFLALALLSLAGLMLCSTANDLIWLFLSLELTSLPTYIMIATSRRRAASQESAVKYFFLGAMAAAIFLYGFAMLYGATGSLHLTEIHQALTEQYAATGHVNPLAILGVTLILIGVGFKIAAVPMHFYTADVYEGADTPVTAFLAFVPKTAGFVVIMIILCTVQHLGQGHALWPAPIHDVLWVLAVLTMTIGNALAMFQKNLKRILAYSSVAHSGYMLVGVIAGMELMGSQGHFLSGVSGYSATLFYLIAYGMTTMGAFLMLCSFARQGRELETLDDLQGLHAEQKGGASILALCVLSLMGLPPLIGFLAKLLVFAAGLSVGEYALVIIACLNSAAAAWYYLQVAGIGWLTDPAPAAAGVNTSTGGASEEVVVKQSGEGLRRTIAWIGAVSAVALLLIASPLMHATADAVQPGPSASAVRHVSPGEQPAISRSDASSTSQSAGMASANSPRLLQSSAQRQPSVLNLSR